MISMNESGVETQGNLPEITSEKDKKILSKSYEIDGVNIAVNYQSIKPKLEGITEESLDPASVIIWLPGWSQDAGAKSDELIGQVFADAGKREVLVIDTKPDKNTNDSLYKETQAISMLIKEKGIKNIIIAGHSEGGIKAVDLAVVLQKQKEAGEIGLTIDGIILEESVGLYNQGNAFKFAGKFATDAIIDFLRPNLKGGVMRREGARSTKARTMQLFRDVISGFFREVGREKAAYPQRLLAQVQELKSLNPHVSEVKVPVILVNGASDIVSNPDKILPGYKDLDDATLGYGVGKDKKISSNLSHAIYNHLREDVLRESLFPNAPFVRMLIARRLGSHGMPVYRAEQIAKDSLYLLERSKREKVQTPTVAKIDKG